jgi:hypothetical protein
MSVLEKSGIGTHIEQTPNGLQFGLFDAAKSNDVLSNVDGKVVANWDKMAKYTFGLPNAKGMGFKFGGMEFADQLRTFASSDQFGQDVGVTTVF